MSAPAVLLFDGLESPIGRVVLATFNETLVMVDFADNEPRYRGLLAKRFGAFQFEPARNPLGVTAKLEAYFAGQLAATGDIAVSTGGTDFQERVWAGLRRIPAGKTWSYLDLAKHVGSPSAVRAVGATNGLNPVSIVLPCHRVVGAGGSLTGYAGGLERKRWLLEHEGAKPGKALTQGALFGELA